jgi:hypothetical protein
MTRKICISMLAALAVLATAALAGAQSGGTPRLAQKAPFLGKVSGGGAVNYQFDRTPGTQTVTIAGYKAKVHTVGTAANHEYNAIVNNESDLKAGRTYRVVITALARSGKTKLTYDKVLYMHRSLNRPQSG